MAGESSETESQLFVNIRNFTKTQAAVLVNSLGFELSHIFSSDLHTGNHVFGIYSSY